MTMFAIEQRVYYEDTDAGGIVYHSNYIKFMERVRSEWLWSLGIYFNQLNDEAGLGFAVHHISVDFKKPAILGDKLLCTASVHSYRKSSMTFDQSILNADNNDIVYCSGQVRIVCINRAGRAQPLPKIVLEKMT